MSRPFDLSLLKPIHVAPTHGFTRQLDLVKPTKPKQAHKAKAKKRLSRKEFRQINKLYRLLDVALDDFASVIASPDYRIHMGMWHGQDYWGSNSKCAVCLAGSVMAGTLQTKVGRCINPEAFGDRTARRMYALDELREGNVVAALSHLVGSNKGEVTWDLQPDGDLRAHPKLLDAIRLSWKWRAKLEPYDGDLSKPRARAFLGKLRVLQADLKAADL